MEHKRRQFRHTTKVAHLCSDMGPRSHIALQRNEQIFRFASVGRVRVPVTKMCNQVRACEIRTPGARTQQEAIADDCGGDVMTPYSRNSKLLAVCLPAMLAGLLLAGCSQTAAPQPN